MNNHLTNTHALSSLFFFFFFFTLASILAGQILDFSSKKIEFIDDHPNWDFSWQKSNCECDVYQHDLNPTTQEKSFEILLDF